MPPKKTEPIAPSSPEQYDFESVLAALKEPIDPTLIKSRVSHRDKNGNEHRVDYVEWHTVADRLDDVYPFWETTVEVEPVGEMLVAKVGLTICGVTRYGLGVGDIGKEMGVKKAEHDGLKRAAIKFGVARALYHREATDEETRGGFQGYGSGDGGFPANPLATSDADRVSKAQLGMIRARCNKLQIDPDAECFAAMQADLENISKRAASAFIDHIGAMENGAASLQQAPAGERIVYDEPGYNPPASHQSSAPPDSSVVAQSLGDMVTAKQLGMIKAISREANIDADAECAALMRCSIDELSKRAASDLIEHLQTLSRNDAAPMRRAPAPQTSGAPDNTPTHSGPPRDRNGAVQAKPSGRLATAGQVNAMHNIGSGIGYSDADIANEYSAGRTQKLSELTETEAADAIKLMQKS